MYFAEVTYITYHSDKKTESQLKKTLKVKKENKIMPVITIEAVKLTKEQKRNLVKELTTSAANIINLPEQTFYVFVKENEKDNIGVAGQLLSDK